MTALAGVGSKLEAMQERLKAKLAARQAKPKE